ncbi:radial spoke head 14 homolog isoform X2 [Parasteatoda tepidariorum]|uniref:radial spoke head 14 homolog isoform X2 n=1 Tax=Parasteatoda tepidariorum TaxID=114398 RepID=UPI00077F9DF0|nr:rap1 GTPase-GDP dissociation stimulator 1-like [Parasteatoda tepidariorum]
MAKELVRTKTPITAIGGHVLHPEKHNLAFGRWAMPVMARKMQDPDPIEKRKAIQSLCDFVFDPKRVASKEFLTTAAGRRTFGKQDFYKEVLRLIVDDEKTVRHAANVVLQRLTLSPMAAEELVRSDAIPILLNQVPQEEDDTLELLLQTIYVCCLVDPDKVLLAGGLESIIPWLKSSNSRIKERTAMIIKELTVDAKGRNKALDLGVLPLLLNLLDGNDEKIQAKALSALMMIAIATPAKFLSLNKGAIAKLLPFLKVRNAEIRLNTIKVLTALSEAPPGRKILLDRLPMLTPLLNDNVKEIQDAAKRMISVVTFKP